MTTVPTQPRAAAPAKPAPRRLLPAEHASIAARLALAMTRLHQAENELIVALDLSSSVLRPDYAEDVEGLMETIAETGRELAIHFCSANDSAETN